MSLLKNVYILNVPKYVESPWSVARRNLLLVTRLLQVCIASDRMFDARDNSYNPFLNLPCTKAGDFTGKLAHAGNGTGPTHGILSESRAAVTDHYARFWNFPVTYVVNVSRSRIT